LDKYGINEEGLYRIPGSTTKIKEYRAKFNRGEKVEFPSIEDPANVSSLIIRFLKDTKDSIFGGGEDILRSSATLENTERIAAIKKMLSSIPPCYQATLKYFVKHLNTISKNADKK